MSRGVTAAVLRTAMLLEKGAPAGLQDGPLGTPWMHMKEVNAELPRFIGEKAGKSRGKAANARVSLSLIGSSRAGPGRLVHAPFRFRKQQSGPFSRTNVFSKACMMNLHSWLVHLGCVCRDRAFHAVPARACLFLFRRHC